MMKTIRVLKVSGVFIALILSSSAFADIEPVSPSESIEAASSLTLQSSDAIQDLDQAPANDSMQVSELLTDQIRTTQAMHAGDEELSEPVSDEL